MGSETPEGIIRRLAENGLGIRFGRGVVGKTSHAVIVLLLTWAVIIWRLGDGLIANCFLIFAGLVATAIFVWWTKSTQGFAERNPAQAMLDGAEFVEYQRFQAEISGVGTVDTNKSALGGHPARSIAAGNTDV